MFSVLSLTGLYFFRLFFDRSEDNRVVAHFHRHLGSRYYTARSLIDNRKRHIRRPCSSLYSPYTKINFMAIHYNPLLYSVNAILLGVTVLCQDFSLVFMFVFLISQAGFPRPC